MILEALFGFSLALNVSLDAPAITDSSRTVWLRMPVPKRDAALLPLVHRATDRIVHKVATDPRIRTGLRPA